MGVPRIRFIHAVFGVQGASRFTQESDFGSDQGFQGGPRGIGEPLQDILGGAGLDHLSQLGIKCLCLQAFPRLRGLNLSTIGAASNQSVGLRLEGWE